MSLREIQRKPKLSEVRKQRVPFRPRCRVVETGERAFYRFSAIENGLTIHKYWSLSCPRCPLKTQCTTSSYRRITRWDTNTSWRQCSGSSIASPKR